LERDLERWGNEGVTVDQDYKPRVGDLGFTVIGGLLGVLVYLGQWFNGDRSDWTHVFIVVNGQQAVEAQPGGARITPLSRYDNRRTVYVTPQGTTEEQRLEAARQALGLVGTPYSFLDYFSLFLTRMGWGWGVTKRYVKETGHMICSQFVDESYRRAGVHFFDDGRLPQDVTPGDLAVKFNV
jgi:uncharacterized protein YycO